ncbi:MAG: hypothetical protein K1Y02_12755 [Candidatus Hydrogenedentes bacterium]|nr:hypothetical protein [Candidatus Hydrogenedentota bacterium]
MSHKATAFVVALVLVVFGCSFLAHAELRAGIANMVVTPDPLLPVSGGVGIPEPVEKKLGELEVRALVIEQGDTRVAIVSMPFLGFPSILCDRIRAKVEDIPHDNIIIGSTHVHSAPDMYAFGDEKGNTLADLNYIDKVCGQTADAINQALANVKPAGVKIATDKANGKIAYNYYAEKLYDPRCSVLQFVGQDGKPFATLVNYAIHPEIIGPDQKILSPDLVGPLYERIAANGGGMGIFMNSAQGGMITADCRGPEGKDIQTWDECIRIGNLLADEALRIVSGAAVQQDPKLLCAATKITFPIESLLMLAVIANSPLKYPMNPDKSVTTLVNVVNLGNAQILTIPGEALPNIGFYLKRKMKGENNLLFGLTNDAFGYILTKEDFNSFERYNYVSRTSLGEKTGTILVDEALKFVDSLPAPEKLQK